MMRPALLSLILTLANPALAEDGPNLVPSKPAAMGAVRASVLAWQLYALGVAREDPVVMLTAIRMAHGSDPRAATGWTLDTPGPIAEAPPPATGLPRDPASGAAMALAVLMAEGDPDLADLAADIEAGLSQRKAQSRISTAQSTLAAGASDSWRIPFYGQSRAELAVIEDAAGEAGLTLSVTDAAGVTICATGGPDALSYCAFTPARNGYFTVTVSNPGALAHSYRLLSN